MDYKEKSFLNDKITELEEQQQADALLMRDAGIKIGELEKQLADKEKENIRLKAQWEDMAFEKLALNQQLAEMFEVMKTACYQRLPIREGWRCGKPPHNVCNSSTTKQNCPLLGGVMGRKTYQEIKVCCECGRTPEDGEEMWEMPDGYICKTCSEK